MKGIDTQNIPPQLQENHAIDIDLYSAGFFDGLTGLDATYPQIDDYWLGYCLGYREYCCGLLGVETPETEPNSYWQHLASA